jgi:hypothetical protein
MSTVIPPGDVPASSTGHDHVSIQHVPLLPKFSLYRLNPSDLYFATADLCHG